ncbi:hypothetical protein SAMN05216302_105316 [Nitrosomonas aestuarii]|uniref:Uncharacterized protein n=1 Tax=Nitrosomonas aestuarii TaxID=52441 RepID=A0A1I4GH15_9PROT|nr:hypothetical protein [Nitrosomonas aestuarii]SFL28481.1 hypothetical protein SAMN05216302_105316 [Nitrosomonas aestuarii]
MRNLWAPFLLYFITNNVSALSIVYDGHRCDDDSSIANASAQSRFTVVRDLGNGNYELSLDGAFLDYEEKLCLKPLNTFLTEVEKLQSQVAPIQAFAFFNGDVLVVSYGTLARNPGTALDNPPLFEDISFPRAFTLVFDYEPSRQVFKLRSASFLTNVFTNLASPDGNKSFSAFWTNFINLTDEIEFYLEE